MSVTTPKAQLEVAAQWLRDGALALRGKEPSYDMYRVADDCEKVARKMADSGTNVVGAE